MGDEDTMSGGVNPVGVKHTPSNGTVDRLSFHPKQGCSL